MNHRLSVVPTILTVLGVCASVQAAEPVPALKGLSLNTQDAQQKLVNRHLLNRRESKKPYAVSGNSSSTASTEGLSFSAFVTGLQSDLQHDATLMETAYRQDGDHYAAGVDIQFSPEWLAGMAYGETDVNDGSGLTDLLHLYSSWYRRDFAVDMSLSYASADLTVTEGDWVGLHLSGAFDFNQYGWVYGPLAALDIQYGELDAFNTMATNPGAELHIDQQDLNSAILTMGLQAAFSGATGPVVWVPRLKAVARYQIDNDPEWINGYLLSSPDVPVSLTPDKPDTTWFEVSAGIALNFSGRFSLYVDYETVVDDRNRDQDNVMAGFTIQF